MPKKPKLIPHLPGTLESVVDTNLCRRQEKRGNQPSPVRAKSAGAWAAEAGINEIKGAGKLKAQTSQPNLPSSPIPHFSQSIKQEGIEGVRFRISSGSGVDQRFFPS